MYVSYIIIVYFIEILANLRGRLNTWLPRFLLLGIDVEIFEVLKVLIKIRKAQQG